MINPILNERFQFSHSSNARDKFLNTFRVGPTVSLYFGIDMQRNLASVTTSDGRMDDRRQSSYVDFSNQTGCCQAPRKGSANLFD